eukprot:104-Rhodomonas_salina.1
MRGKHAISKTKKLLTCGGRRCRGGDDVGVDNLPLAVAVHNVLLRLHGVLRLHGRVLRLHGRVLRLTLGPPNTGSALLRLSMA